MLLGLAFDCSGVPVCQAAVILRETLSLAVKPVMQLPSFDYDWLSIHGRHHD
jgi:hypothetical protein